MEMYLFLYEGYAIGRRQLSTSSLVIPLFYYQKARILKGISIMPSQIVGEPIVFTRGVPPFEALPNKLISECVQAVLEGSDARNVLQYGQHGGYLPLRKMLAELYTVSVEQILVGNGSLHLQDLLSSVLIHAGQVVFVEQPSYDLAIRTFRRRGARVVGIPLEHDGVNLVVLEEALTRQVPAFLYLVPDFQNPAGVTTAAEKREALVELAQRYGFWLVEDITYRVLRYTGESIPSLRDLNAERVITISSFSKLISPALRVGYLVGPLELVKSLTKLAEDTLLTPVLPTQAAVLEFHHRGYFASNLESLKHLYASRLQTIVNALQTTIPTLTFTKPQGGFFVSITLPTQTDRTNFLERAQQVGLILMDGRAFFADSVHADQNGDQGERFVRLPFCALTPAQIEEGIKRLASLIAM